MGISKIAFIAIGSVAACLFLIIFGLLIAKLLLAWKAKRSRVRYKRVANKYHKNKHGLFVVPKLSNNFPTSPFHIQLSDSTPASDEDDKYSEQRTPTAKKVSFDRIHEMPKTRKKGIFGRDSSTMYDLRRNRRVLSDSDILMVQRDRDMSDNFHDVVKQRSQSEKSEKWGKIKRSVNRSGLRALSEISGQIEYTVLYDSSGQKLAFEVIQIFDINEITPDLFLDQCEVLDIKDVTLDIEKPCLIRGKDQTITFSSMSELGLYVQITMFPKKINIGTTQCKHGSNSLVFNERFIVGDRNLQDFHGCSVRFQVLLRYGKHPQNPIIIGETIMSLKNIKSDVIIPFTDYLKLPVDENVFESTLSEDMNLGHLIVSVRYQLLQQTLTIRVVRAIDLPRTTIHGQPNSSVKIMVFLNEHLQFKRTTEIVRKTTKPNFKQSFDIDLAQNKLNHVGILLQVRLHGMYKTVLGYVHIGPAAEGTGREHWDEVLSFSDFNSESVFDISNKKPNSICLSA